MLISYYHDKPRHERVVLVTEKVLVQARLPAALVRELDELLKEGYYRDRTEAISDAIRRLIETFSKRDRISKTVRLYLMGKLPQDRTLDDAPTIENIEEFRRVIIELYGTDRVDEVLNKMRRRIP